MFNIKFHKFFILLPLVMMLCGCADDNQVRKDVAKTPQDAQFFANLQQSEIKVTPSDVEKNKQNFLQHYFAMWSNPFLVYENVAAVRKKVDARADKFTKNPGWNVNRNPHTAEWMKNIVSNMQLDTFPNVSLPAIAVRDSDLRTLPTNLPSFADWDKPGSNYPFDDLQESMVSANEPLYVLQVSRDKQWQLVLTHGNSFGWIRTLDIAYVDAQFIKQWRTSEYVIVTRDDQSVFDDAKHYYLTAHLGQLFPLQNTTAQSYQVLTAVRNEVGNALIKTVNLNKTSAAIWPLALNKKNLVDSINTLMGGAYGWGGMYGLRDCSSTTQDLFALFAIWLPRNSGDQAKIGKVITLEGLSNKQKEQKILEQGVPLLTLLNKRGHVVLYLGTYDGKPYVFQQMWGLATKNYFTRREGRAVVGKSVITRLDFGKKYLNVPTTLLNNLVSMTLINQSSLP